MQIAHRFFQNHSSVNFSMEDFESLMKIKFEQTSWRIIRIKWILRTQILLIKDLIYSQGEISTFRRNKIVEELKRIYNNYAHLCLGEKVKLRESIPKFLREIFESYNLDCLFKNQVINYYKEKKLKAIESIDLPYILKEYYEIYRYLLKIQIPEITENEKIYN